jgi:protease-4
MAVRKGRVFLAFLLVVVALIVIAGQMARRIPSRSVLEMKLSGPVSEEDWPSFEARVWEGEVTVFRNLLEALDRAAADDRIAGVSLRVGWPGMSFGTMQELRAKLQEFTASGKFCTAYLEAGTNMNYYLASACPEVYLTPTSGLLLKGLMGQTTFLRGTLDKLAITPNFERIGEYKNAPNVYTQKQYTPEHREEVTALLTHWQDQLIEGIAESRRLEPEQVEGLVRSGPFLGEEAVENKLVDKLLYADEYRDLLEKKAGSDELNTIDVSSYLERSTAASGPEIALVHATGDIVPGSSGYHPSVGRMMGADTIAEALRSAREDDSIKAIVLRVDSPGGVQFASEIIRREVELAKDKKPVVVSMSDVAASGGYYISASATKIVADPGTVTGSIGIYTGKMNLKGFYAKLGMTKDYVALAPNATLFYPFENFTPEQRQTVQRFLQAGYQAFLDGVSKGRGMSLEEADKLGRGRVWLGSQAKEVGLVDELGGLERAVALAKELAHIPASQKVSYRIYPREKSVWEQFTDWLQVRESPFPPPRDWFDASRLPLLREPLLFRMPYQVVPE